MQTILSARDIALAMPPILSRDDILSLDLTSAKARKILHDGTVRGHALTDKQRRFMGWKSSQGKRKRKKRKGYSLAAPPPILSMRDIALAYEESKHPRAENGEWTDKGESATTEKRTSLRERVNQKMKDAFERVKNILDTDNQAVLYSPELTGLTRQLVIHPSAKEKGKWQVTQLDAEQSPVGHALFSDRDDAIRYATGASTTKGEPPFGTADWSTEVPACARYNSLHGDA